MTNRDAIRPDWLTRIGFVAACFGELQIYVNRNTSTPVHVFRASTGEQWHAILSTGSDSPVYPWPRMLTCRQHLINLCVAAEIKLDDDADVQF